MVEDRRQAVPSGPGFPAAKIAPPANQAVNNPASSRPPPVPTEVEENDYDSDDASKAGLGVSAACRLPHLRLIWLCSSLHSHAGISGVQPAVRAGEPHAALLRDESQGKAPQG